MANAPDSNAIARASRQLVLARDGLVVELNRDQPDALMIGLDGVARSRRGRAIAMEQGLQVTGTTP